MTEIEINHSRNYVLRKDRFLVEEIRFPFPSSSTLRSEQRLWRMKSKHKEMEGNFIPRQFSAELPKIILSYSKSCVG